MIYIICDENGICWDFGYFKDEWQAKQFVYDLQDENYYLERLEQNENDIDI